MLHSFRSLGGRHVLALPLGKAVPSISGYRSLSSSADLLQQYDDKALEKLQKFNQEFLQEIKTSQFSEWSKLNGQWMEKNEALNNDWKKTYEALEDQCMEKNRELYDKLTDKLTDKWTRSSKELNDQWMEKNEALSERLNKQIQCKIAENERLKNEALNLMDQILISENIFNVRGMLERTVYVAELEGIIPWDSKRGTQGGLNMLANQKDFHEILHKQVQARSLRKRDVLDCLKGIYHVVSKSAHGNDGVITVRAKDFHVNDRAVIVSYLEFQKKLPRPLTWKEVTEKKKEQKGE